MKKMIGLFILFGFLVGCESEKRSVITPVVTPQDEQLKKDFKGPQPKEFELPKQPSAAK